jgi:hypothetical protein
MASRDTTVVRNRKMSLIAIPKKRKPKIPMKNMVWMTIDLGEPIERVTRKAQESK